jgi:hypothetical protein
MGFSSDDQLNALNLIVTPQEIGMGYLSYSQVASKTQSVVSGMARKLSSEYIILNPKEIVFYTTQ